MVKTAMLAAVTVSCLVPVMASPVRADHRAGDTVDTQTLYGWCKPYPLGEAGVGQLCTGYISAVSDIFDDGLAIGEYRACIPEHATIADLRAIVFEKLETVPKDTGETAYGWVAQAIAERFPCGH